MDPFKTLRKAIRKDHASLAGATDTERSRWLDRFDPHGDYGLNKVIRIFKSKGIHFTYQEPR